MQKPSRPKSDFRAICLWVTDKARGTDNQESAPWKKGQVDAVNSCSWLQWKEMETQEWLEMLVENQDINHQERSK